MFRYEMVWTIGGKPLRRSMTRKGLLAAMCAGPYGVKASKANNWLQTLENAAVLGDPAVLEDKMPHGTREIKVWRLTAN